MFAAIDADYYIMADGDSTYPAEYGLHLVKALIDKSADMAVGKRITPPELVDAAYRPMHVFGNKLVCWLIARTFGAEINKLCSLERVGCPPSAYCLKTLAHQGLVARMSIPGFRHRR